MSGDRRVAASAEPSTQVGLAEGAPSAASDNAPTHRQTAQLALEEIIRPVAIAGLLTCIAVSLAQFVTQIVPEWPGRVFVGLAFLVSLESIHGGRLLDRKRLDTRDRLRFGFVEWVVLLLLVRFAVYLEYGFGQLLSDVAVWSLDVTKLFDAGFILNSLLIAVIWVLARMLSRTIQELEASPIERMPSVTDPGHYLRTTMPRHGRTDRQARLQRITNVYLGGGVLLLLLAGLSRVDVRDLVVFGHSRSSGIILNVLAYFLIGLLIISQAQYTILRANWELQSIPILGRMGRRWLLLVLLFLMLLGLASALLPVSYSVGLIDTVSTVLQWIIYAIVRIGFGLIFILSMVLGWLFSLFSGRQAESSPPPTRARPPPPPATVAHEASPWWLVARSLVFWVILVGVIGYSLFHFANDRWAVFRGLSAARFIAWLRGLCQSLWVGTRRAARSIRRRIGERLVSRRPAGGKRRWRYISLRRLSPRDRVRYYYLSTVQRSARQGFGRPRSRTPLEYEETLAEEVPVVADQVRDLTWAFVEARYSEHSITRDDASAIRAAWRRIKRALARRRRGTSGEPHSSSPGEGG